MRRGMGLDEGGSLTPSTLGLSVVSRFLFLSQGPYRWHSGAPSHSQAERVAPRFSQRWLGNGGDRQPKAGPKARAPPPPLPASSGQPPPQTRFCPAPSLLPYPHQILKSLLWREGGCHVPIRIFLILF